jgi:transcriptional regulator with XRE-family HTH domain
MSARRPHPALGHDSSVPALTRWSNQVSLGTRVLNARLAAGVSMGDLAEGLTTVAYLSRIECGERRPSTSLLAGMADRLGVDFVDLVREESPLAEGLRFELSHADLLLATGQYGDAAQVSADLAGIAVELGLAEVASASRAVQAAALASAGRHRAAIATLGFTDDRPSALAASAVAARSHLALSDFETVVSIGRRAAERLSNRERLSFSELADLAVTVCVAYLRAGQWGRACRAARSALGHLPLGRDSAVLEPGKVRTTGLSSYGSFRQAARASEEAVAAFEGRRLQQAIAALEELVSSAPRRGCQELHPHRAAIG